MTSGYTTVCYVAPYNYLTINDDIPVPTCTGVIDWLAAGTKDLWPYLIALQAIPAVTSLILTPFLPETPRFLMIMKQKEEAAEKCTSADRILKGRPHGARYGTVWSGAVRRVDAPLHNSLFNYTVSWCHCIISDSM